MDSEFKDSFIDQRVAELFPKLEAMMPMTAKQRQKQYDSLAALESAQLKMHYPAKPLSFENGQVLVYITAANSPTRYRKAFTAAINSREWMSAEHTAIKNIAATFISKLAKQFSSDKALMNLEYSERKKVRSTDDKRVEIDLTPWLQKASDILIQLDQHLKGEAVSAPDWREISCAIALGSGRRQSEIHYSLTGEFINDHQIAYSGQLKGKSSKRDGVLLREAVINADTILPAELILQALHYLGSKGKRIDASDPDGVGKVNRTWTKPIAKEVSDSWRIITTEMWAEAGQENEKQTYHSFRGLYYLAQKVNISKDHPNWDAEQISDYFKDILGDNTLTALDSYKRFKLKDGSITKI